MRVFLLDGSWAQVFASPWAQDDSNSPDYQLSQFIRPSGASTPEYIYSLTPIELSTKIPKNVYGRLDGVYHITGFDNVVENTITIEGRNYIVIQDISRTSFADYFALELSPTEST